MKLKRAVLACWIAGACSIAVAGELRDCGLEGTPKAAPPARYVLEVKGDFHSGAEADYARDEPVLVADVRLLRPRQVLVPSADVVLKSSWPLSESFRIPKGMELPLAGVVAHDGRRLNAVSFKSGAVVYVADQNQFCNKTRTVKPDLEVWQAGTLSMLPDDVVFERTTKELAYAARKLRIIYLGTSGGIMTFREIWVQGAGGTPKSSDRTFDQFARSIDIAGFRFQVLEVRPDKVKLRNDIQERTEMPTAAAEQFLYSMRQ